MLNLCPTHQPKGLYVPVLEINAVSLLEVSTNWVFHCDT